MKAVVFHKGVGLELSELAIPSVDPEQVLVKVIHTGFCGSDHSLIETEGTPDGTVLGHEVSGIVVETGSEVDSIKTGTRVIIRPTFCAQCPGCKMGKPHLCSNNRRSIGIGDLPGGFAEFVVVYPQMLIPIPENVDMENAALAELFAVSLHGINQSGNRKGSALVIGAGAVGISMVKLLKLSGYGPVVVSEPVESKRKLAAKFGADLVVDPTNEDLMSVAFHHTTTAGFQTVFECSGVATLLSTAMNVAGLGGTVCQLSVLYRDIPINPAIMMFKELKLVGSYGNTHAENIQCLKWMSDQSLDTRPIISDRITLDQLPQVYKEKIHPGKTIKVMLNIG